QRPVPGEQRRGEREAEQQHRADAAAEAQAPPHHPGLGEQPAGPVAGRPSARFDARSGRYGGHVPPSPAVRPEPAACPPSLSSTGWVPARSSLLYRFPALSSPGRVPARVGDRPDRYPEPSLSGIGPHPGPAVTFSHPGGYPQGSSRAIGDVGAKSGRDHMFSHTCARPTEMTPMRRLRAACLAALMVATGALVAVATASPAQAAPVICEKFGSTSIQNGTYIVQNNVWGADTTQCIDVN